MKAPIFSFTDDLDIFRSAQGAEKYLESWIVESGFEAFDSDGRILSASVELKPGKRLLWLIPTTAETVVISETSNLDAERLKSKLISYLDRLESNQPADGLGNNRSLKDLINEVVRKKGYSD